MSYRVEGRDLVIDGFDKGIAPSPYQGIADMRNVNIISVPDEVSVAFKTTAYTFPSGGSVTVTALTDYITLAGSSFYAGMAFTVSNTANGLTAGTKYWVGGVSGTSFKAFTNIKDAIANNSPVDITSDGSNTLTTITPGEFKHWAYDPSGSSSYFNYFAMDSNGEVWALSNSSNKWMPLGHRNASSQSQNGNGLIAYQGWIFAFTDAKIDAAPNDVNLPSASFLAWTNDWQYLNSGTVTHNTHYGLVGYDDTVYYCDGTFIGSFYAISDFARGTASAGSAANDYVTISIQNGTRPAIGSTIVFRGSTLPGGITAGTTYYVYGYSSIGVSSANVQLSSTLGGTLLNLTTDGTAGDWTWSNFDVNSSGTYVFTRQALALPSNETAQSLAELGQTLLIGGTTNRIYPWNRIASSFTIPILVAENNIQKMVTVNTNTFIFAGNRGRIYKTNGSQAQLYVKIPDYVTGVIEPYITWKAFGYNRNQIYFSFSATNNSGTNLTTTGGLWALDIDLDCLRMVNKLSYDTYNGYASVFIPTQSTTQTANGFGFNVGWYSGSTYGMDVTSANPYANYETYVETDIIPVGTLWQRRTFEQVEFLLSAPLVSGEGVKIEYRTNLTESWSGVGDTYETTTAGVLADVYTVNWQNVQWIQFKISTKSTSSSPSYTRLRQIRVR